MPYPNIRQADGLRLLAGKHSPVLPWYEYHASTHYGRIADLWWIDYNQDEGRISDGPFDTFQEARDYLELD